MCIRDRYLSVNPDWLVGDCDNMFVEEHITSSSDEDSDEYIDNTSKLPILGTICAGDGVYIEEEYDEHIFIDQGMGADFALRVKGDSMIEAGIFDGDLVFIRQQSSVRNGKIAAVRLTEWNEASLKKIFVKNDNVILYPCLLYTSLHLKQHDNLYHRLNKRQLRVMYI